MRWKSSVSLVLLVSLMLVGASAQEPKGGDGELYVAVGHGGRRIVSRDGFTWENDQRWSDEGRDTDQVLADIAYGLDRFVAVGGNSTSGRILLTRDGRDWRELPAAPSQVETIAFGTDRFVACRSGELLASTDGEKFQPGQRLDWKGEMHALRSACGDTEAGFRFVIIGDAVPVGGQNHVSWRGTTGDGERWDVIAMDTPEARDVAYGAGHFVVVGPAGLIESSHDGQTWRRQGQGVDEDFTRVLWTGIRFLACGSSAVWSSPDGMNWAKEPGTVPGTLVWAQEKGLGLGFAWDGGIVASRDLVHWQKVPLIPGPPLKAIAGRIARQR